MLQPRALINTDANRPARSRDSHHLLVGLLFALATGFAWAAAPELTADSPDCASCHAKEVELWQTSHHAQSMAAATQTTTDKNTAATEAVLGDFADASRQHFDLRGDFTIIDGYPVMALTRGKTTTRHVITNTFGVYPLQQYLTNASNGKKQVLPFAWDTRPPAEGGQRWITVHPTEDIPPADRLHWQQPLANWNGMCADCHSTGFKRNFNAESNSFKSVWDEINVGCASCHGNRPHAANAIAAGSAAGFTPRYPLPDTEPGKTAAATDPQHAQNTLGVCAACHSLRTPLVDGINPNHHFLDQFSPTLPTPPLYFPDGQIRDEVYVWGSFLQSRMHAEGVTCGNCHEPHSQKLLAQGNALCSQCHLAEQYAAKTHHRHAVNGPGAECVDCHMTSRTYMAVDDRHDHSFRVPNPALSLTTGAPDACSGCHRGKTVRWAADTIAGWRKEKKDTSRVDSSHAVWARQQAGQPLGADTFTALQNDSSLPAILRAAAITRHAQQQPMNAVPGLADLLKSEEPLVVLAAARNPGAATNDTLSGLLSPLLKHPLRAIRIAAANTLGVQTEEVELAQEQISWRGEGLLNKALQHERRSEITAAKAAYETAITIDPAFEPAWINLAELHRRANDMRAEQLLYSQALKQLPDSAVLHYSYALHLVRRKNTQAAVKHTAQALALEPGNGQSAYLHLLLLESLGRAQEGVGWLHTHLQQQGNSPQVLQAGIKLATGIGDRDSANVFAAALAKAHANTGTHPTPGPGSP